MQSEYAQIINISNLSTEITKQTRRKVAIINEFYILVKHNNVRVFKPEVKPYLPTSLLN